MEFFSNFSIGQECEFIPRQKDCNDMGIRAETMEGTVVAVRFTAAKVFYDCLSPYWGRVFHDIPAGQVAGIRVIEKKLAG